MQYIFDEISHVFTHNKALLRAEIKFPAVSGMNIFKQIRTVNKDGAPRKERGRPL